MTIDEFQSACGFDSLLEVEKVCHLAFFQLKKANVQEFSVADAAKWLVDSGGALPNRTRLDDRLRASRDTVRSPRGYRLRGEFIKALESKYPSISQKSQTISDLRFSRKSITSEHAGILKVLRSKSTPVMSTIYSTAAQF